VGAEWTVVFALRLGVLVLRSRTEVRFPLLRVAGDAAGYSLGLPQAWLEDNPLTAAALETESERWKAIGMRFSVSELSDKRVAELKRA